MTGESADTDVLIRETMIQNYGLERLDFVYIVNTYWKIDAVTGQESFNFSALRLSANLTMIMMLGFSIIFFCWYKIHHELSRQNLSLKTLDMQHQLFRSLVAQTILPMLFLFIPLGLILIVPILKIELGHAEVFVLWFVESESFSDALVPLFFIKTYRVMVQRWISKLAFWTTLTRISAANGSVSFTSTRVGNVL